MILPKWSRLETEAIKDLACTGHHVDYRERSSVSAPRFCMWISQWPWFKPKWVVRHLPPELKVRFKRKVTASCIETQSSDAIILTSSCRISESEGFRRGLQKRWSKSYIISLLHVASINNTLQKTFWFFPTICDLCN